MGICQMQDLLRHSEIKIENGNQVIENPVNSCQACQVTNAISNPQNSGTWLQGKKPGKFDMRLPRQWPRNCWKIYYPGMGSPQTTVWHLYLRLIRV